MMLTHVAMIGGMVVLMVWRWDRYAGGAHCHQGGARVRQHPVTPSGSPSV
jgi:hypothetical protein